MSIKRCSKCRLTFNTNLFYFRQNGPKAGTYYEWCKECFKIRGRVYYHQNRERQKYLALLRKNKYRDQRKTWLDNIKNRPCMDCGVKYAPYIMDFDHRDKNTKIASVSWIAIRNTSNLSIIQQEINKCDLVCANCHRQRTHDRIQKLKNAAVAKVVKADA